MVGALIETETRKIWNEAAKEAAEKYAKEAALRMLQDGELPTDKIAKYSGLSISEVEQIKTKELKLFTV